MDIVDGARGLVLVAAALLAGPAAAAGSCLVGDTDLGRVDGPAQRTPLAKGRTALSPCHGRVGDGPAVEVLYSHGGGRLQVAMVRPATELRDAVPGPLVDLVEPGSLVAIVWRSVTQARPLRPASKRFDELDGPPLGGPVLAGRDLRLPLAPFGWNAAEPVTLAVAGRPARLLRPVDGAIVLPVASMGLGRFRLTQGRRESALEVVGAGEFEGLADALRQIETDPASADLRALRLTYLFGEQGLTLNAIAADAQR